MVVRTPATTTTIPEPGEPTTTAVPTAPTTPPPLSCKADATIKPNDSGLSVACLQSRLRELGVYSGGVSGIDDIGTVAAVKAFQKATKPLTADGFAGPRTLAALGIWSGISRQTQFAPGMAPQGPWPSPVLEVANFALTPEGIPFHAGRVPCSRADADIIAFQFALDGADADTQRWAVYIASREGGCNFQTINNNAKTADDSHCTFQLNVLSGTFAPNGELGRRGWTPELVRSSMEMCANAASDLWVYCGRGPWEPPYWCSPPWQSATASLAPLLPSLPAGVVLAPTASLVSELSTQRRSVAAKDVMRSCASHQIVAPSTR